MAAPGCSLGSEGSGPSGPGLDLGDAVPEKPGGGLMHVGCPPMLGGGAGRAEPAGQVHLLLRLWAKTFLSLASVSP